MSPDVAFSDVVLRVIEAAPADRDALIAGLCRDHPDWIAVVRQLVSGWDRALSTASLTRRAFGELATLAPGTRIGGYVIERELARGGMGVVYAGRDPALDMPVAIKALRPELSHDPRQLDRLRREARTLARLSANPHIARVHAFVEDEGAGFIVQELVIGETLRDRLRNGPLPVDEALEAAVAILDALAAAHREEIVHRDLKPENVMRTESGTYKVLDFGIAVASPDATVTRRASHLEIAGTASYMSPEQLLGQPVDARSDVFSFGILLYELLTGRHPFASAGADSIWSAILVAPPAPLTPSEASTVARGIMDVLTRCLAKRPQDRWPSAGDAAGALRTARERPAAVASAVYSPPPGAAVRWWQFHEAAAAIVPWLMLAAVWRVREWIELFEWRLVFFVLLAALSVAPSLRLSLWFVSSTEPSRLRTHAARCRPWILAGDLAFTACLLATGVALSHQHDGWATLFVAVGLGSLVVAGFVEPMSAEAAFDALDAANVEQPAR